MGLLDDYNIDMTEVNEASYGKRVPDDWYEFVLASAHVQKGSKSDPDASWLIFSYSLEPDGDTFDELFGLPKDPSAPTPAELDKLAFLKRRLKDLGIAEDQLNSWGEDDVVGVRGKFELVTTLGKKGTKSEGKEFQNIRNLTTFDGDEAPAAAPVKEKAPATKKAPAKRPPSAEKAAKTAVDNPFA